MIFYTVLFIATCAIAHNVSAVWMLLTQYYQSFGGPDKGFAKHRTEGTRPRPAKCRYSEP
jgi:hypothetical protein